MKQVDKSFGHFKQILFLLFVIEKLLYIYIYPYMYAILRTFSILLSC